MDLSEHVKPAIRKILDGFVENVESTKPCIFRGDLDCIEENLRKVGLAGLKKAERLAANPRLRKLFARLYSKDRSTLKQLRTFPNGEIIRPALLLCNMFNYKTDKIRQYLLERN